MAAAHDIVLCYPSGEGDAMASGMPEGSEQRECGVMLLAMPSYDDACEALCS